MAWIQIIAWMLWAVVKRDIHCTSWLLRGKYTHRGHRWVQNQVSHDGVDQGVRIQIACDCGTVFLDRVFKMELS